MRLKAVKEVAPVYMDPDYTRVREEVGGETCHHLNVLVEAHATTHKGYRKQNKHSRQWTASI